MASPLEVKRQLCDQSDLCLRKDPFLANLQAAEGLLEFKSDGSTDSNSYFILPMQPTFQQTPNWSRRNLALFDGGAFVEKDKKNIYIGASGFIPTLGAIQQTLRTSGLFSPSTSFAQRNQQAAFKGIDLITYLFKGFELHLRPHVLNPEIYRHLQDIRNGLMQDPAFLRHPENRDAAYLLDLLEYNYRSVFATSVEEPSFLKPYRLFLNLNLGDKTIVLPTSQVFDPSLSVAETSEALGILELRSTLAVRSPSNSTGPVSQLERLLEQMQRLSTTLDDGGGVPLQRGINYLDHLLRNERYREIAAHLVEWKLAHASKKMPTIAQLNQEFLNQIGESGVRVVRSSDSIKKINWTLFYLGDHLREVYEAMYEPLIPYLEGGQISHENIPELLRTFETKGGSFRQILTDFYSRALSFPPQERGGLSNLSEGGAVDKPMKNISSTSIVVRFLSPEKEKVRHATAQVISLTQRLYALRPDSTKNQALYRSVCHLLSIRDKLAAGLELPRAQMEELLEMTTRLEAALTEQLLPIESMSHRQVLQVIAQTFGRPGVEFNESVEYLGSLAQTLIKQSGETSLVIEAELVSPKVVPAKEIAAVGGELNQASRLVAQASKTSLWTYLGVGANIVGVILGIPATLYSFGLTIADLFDPKVGWGEVGVDAGLTAVTGVGTFYAIGGVLYTGLWYLLTGTVAIAGAPVVVGAGLFVAGGALAYAKEGLREDRDAHDFHELFFKSIPIEQKARELARLADKADDEVVYKTLERLKKWNPELLNPENPETQSLWRSKVKGSSGEKPFAEEMRDTAKGYWIGSKDDAVALLIIAQLTGNKEDLQYALSKVDSKSYEEFRRGLPYLKPMAELKNGLSAKLV